MRVNPYGEEPVRLAVAMANEPPQTVAALTETCDRAGLVISERPTRGDLDKSLVMLQEWTGVVDAPDTGTRVERLNEMLARYASYPRLTNHAGDGFHIHFREERCPLHRVLAIIIAAGTALHLAERGIHRLGRCQAAGCSLIFGDFSRTGTQRYCSVRCANRDAVRRHRERAGGDPVQVGIATQSSPKVHAPGAEKKAQVPPMPDSSRPGLE